MRVGRDVQRRQARQRQRHRDHQLRRAAIVGVLVAHAREVQVPAPRQASLVSAMRRWGTMGDDVMG
jgi:hypothetical protein